MRATELANALTMAFPVAAFLFNRRRRSKATDVAFVSSAVTSVTFHTACAFEVGAGRLLRGLLLADVFMIHALLLAACSRPTPGMLPAMHAASFAATVAALEWAPVARVAACVASGATAAPLRRLGGTALACSGVAALCFLMAGRAPWLHALFHVALAPVVAGWGGVGVGGGVP